MNLALVFGLKPDDMAQYRPEQLLDAAVVADERVKRGY